MASSRRSTRTRRGWLLALVALGLVALALLVAACAPPLPEPSRTTPIPTAAPSDAATDPDGSDPSTGTDPDSGLPLIALAALPPEAADTMGWIGAGGPYPYPQDGSVFENREGILPDADRGYYHEFTVETPGSADRGARRIVVGNQGEAYWTDDHYASFWRIAP